MTADHILGATRIQAFEILRVAYGGTTKVIASRLRTSPDLHYSEAFAISDRLAAIYGALEQ